MAFEPRTIVHLLNVPFENDYKNVLYYTSKSHQYNTLIARKVRSFTDFTYQRKDNVIRIPAHIDTLWNCNYVMYQNSNFGEKWFYAFITKMEYVNDGVTLVYIETDVYNTWWDDVTVQPSFILREHTKDDTIGINTVPENFELGEYKCDRWEQDQNLNSNDIIVIGVTEDSSGYKHGGARYGGVYSGIKYLWRRTSVDVNTLITQYDEAGKAEAIQCIFMCPSWVVMKDTEDSSGESETTEAAKFYDYSLQAPPSSLDGYFPRNKKLFTYPYRYLLITNNQGSSVVHHNEKYAEYGRRVFRIYGTVTPGCSIRAIPVSYNGISENVDEGVNLGKLPVCNWNSDVYTNWLTQNSVNIASDVGGAIFNTATSALTGDVSGAVNGVFGIMNSIGNVYQHSLVPNASKGNINSGDVMFAGDFATFKFQDMTIKSEYARIIDNFFDMYGYKTNLIKEPNYGHRERWWYTHTIDVNIDGAIPNDDMSIFKNIYNTGVTFWRNINEIQNYTLTNNIITQN